MNERIQTLRQLSLDAVPTISPERAKLITEYYKQLPEDRHAVVIQRAEAFRHVMMHKKIYLHEQEIIVGERGPEPKATPTYPEISLHSLEDLRVLNDRDKVSFKVSTETFEIYEKQIIPFWKGRTQRDRLFTSMSDQWLKAYQAGMFTEFQEQRAPGHTVAGKRLFSMGLLDIIEEIEQVKKHKASKGIPQSQWEELEAMQIAAEAMIAFAKRYVKALELQLEQTTDAARIAELHDMIAVCKRVPAHAPQTFHEVLQHYWFIHVGIISELNPWDSFNPGRLDQHLWPFYQREMVAGSLSKARAKELLQAFWIKFNNHPAPPKVGVTALESNTYTDFALINLGGLTEKGADAVNELSFLILDVIEEMRLLQPSSMVQISKKNPDHFIKRALQITKTGFGQPSFFNTDAIIQQLLRQGKTIEDARNGGASGCVETGAFGTEAYTLSGYFNLTKVLELAINGGFDTRTKQQLGPQTKDLNSCFSFEDFISNLSNNWNGLSGSNWKETVRSNHFLPNGCRCLFFHFS